MYLSRLILNPRNRRVHKEVADPYQMHRSIMRAFPDALGPDDERVLYRLEAQPHDGGLLLLVQSRTLPDWSWLGERGARGLLLPVDQTNPAVKAVDLKLVPGQLLAFRLRANPTTRRRLADGTRKRVGLCREQEQIDWLRRKAEHAGFTVRNARVGRQEVLRGRIHRGEKAHDLRLLAVEFNGVLQVTDPHELSNAVLRGMGSGKGLGFGLLSLAPAHM